MESLDSFVTRFETRAVSVTYVLSPCPGVNYDAQHHREPATQQKRPRSARRVSQRAEAFGIMEEKSRSPSPPRRHRATHQNRINELSNKNENRLYSAGGSA
jgi:hypothetical protein